MDIDERLAGMETDLGDIATELMGIVNVAISKYSSKTCTQEYCANLQSALNDLLNARIKLCCQENYEERQGT